MLTLKYPVGGDPAADSTAAKCPRGAADDNGILLPHADAAFVNFDLERLNPTSWLGRRAASAQKSGVRWALWAVLVIRQIIFRRVRIGRTLLVTSWDDVTLNLKDTARYTVPFNPEMTALGAGGVFMLGLDGAEHKQKRDDVGAVLQDEALDLPGRYAAVSAETAAALLRNSGGEIDVIRDYFTRVCTAAMADLLGLRIDDPDGFADWSFAISALIFGDPFGDPVTRELASYAGVRMRGLVDAAMAGDTGPRAPPPDGLLQRLKARGDWTDADIRAHVMGLAAGIIPTVTLMAGNILAYLLEHDGVRARVVKAATAKDDATLRKLLLETARLRPALDPAQFRLTKDGSGKPIVAFMATATAMRDCARYSRPGCFNAERPLDAPHPNLVFGFGPHECLGRELAVSQLVILFRELLKQPNLAPAKGANGKMHRVQAFPRRLDMTFAIPGRPRGQSMVTIAIPARGAVGGDFAAIETMVRNLGNPATDAVRTALDGAGILHFASMHLIEAGTAEAPAPYLLLEMSSDGTPDDAIAAFAAAMPPAFLDIVRAAARDIAADELFEFLRDHRLDLSPRPWGDIGLDFNGSAEFSVAEKERQMKLSEFASDALTLYRRSGPDRGAAEALAFVRDRIRNSEFRDMLIMPGRRRLNFVEWSDPGIWGFAGNLLADPGIRWLAIGLVSTIVLLAVTILWLVLRTSQQSFVHDLFGWLAWGLIGLAVAAVALFVVIAMTAFLWYRELRRLEDSDNPDPRTADPGKLRRVSETEDAPGYLQNHFLSVSDMKPGRFRRYTFGLALWGVQLVLRYWTRPGFVVDMGTIHFARWLRLPGVEKLVFFSNYDGSWQSYLEDFVSKAHQGQSAVWSNGIGFPRTRGLTGDGASDGARFKRWVRRQQVPSQFWYSRFPKLTLDRIRTNALIHDGLAHASGDSAARAWRDCFGSQARPDAELESEQIQTILFDSMRSHNDGVCLLLSLPGEPAQRRRFLSALIDGDKAHPGLPKLAFGERPDPARAMAYLAFSAQGLECCGLRGDDAPGGFAGFSYPFVAGMAERGHTLNDFGASDPGEWWWNDRRAKAGGKVDAALILLATSPATLAARRAAINKFLKTLGGAVTRAIATERFDRQRPEYEPFGFRDGISQPVIKGSGAATGALARDIVEPGELLFGYRSNQGLFAPSPQLRAERDPYDILPSPVTAPSGRYPDVRPPDPAPAFRDFGRNGSFLVIRQLEQDVEGFHESTRLAAEALAREYPGLAQATGTPINAEWVAAKLLGRWRDGTPLAGNPTQTNRPAATTPAELNDFSFADSDPRGLHCPLGAHIRRANPRDSMGIDIPDTLSITNRHRLLRRGRAYRGGKGEVGILFMALCTDLERQFEFVQQSWVSAPQFHGLDNECDPLAGPRQDGCRRFTIPTTQGPVRLDGLADFVKVRGGGYFFLPGRAALRWLARQ